VRLGSVARWIDGLWREPENRIKVTLLPAMLPFIVYGMIGLRSAEVRIVTAVIATAWMGFVMWRAWCVMREMSKNG
jgi:hypothetical protein